MLSRSSVDNPKGYSMIELVLVMGVLVVLMLLTVTGLRGSQEREDLVAAQRKLLGDFKSVQAKAVAGMEAAGFGIEHNLGVDGKSQYRLVQYRYDLETEGECTDLGGTWADWADDCPSGESSCFYCKIDLNTMSLAEFSSPREKVGFIDDLSEFSVYFFRAPNTGQGKIILPESTETLTLTLEHQNGQTVTLEIDTTGLVAQIEPGS